MPAAIIAFAWPGIAALIALRFVALWTTFDGIAAAVAAIVSSGS